MLLLASTMKVMLVCPGVLALEHLPVKRPLMIETPPLLLAPKKTVLGAVKATGDVQLGFVTDPVIAADAPVAARLPVMPYPMTPVRAKLPEESIVVAPLPTSC